jgi:hypothetical protein
MIHREFGSAQIEPGEIPVEIAVRSRQRRRQKKENPAVGAPGQTLVVIGVYGFKYAARLLVITFFV